MRSPWDTPLLLPEDLRKWVPENHMVHFFYCFNPRAHMKRDGALTVGLIPRPLGRKTGGAGDLFPRIRYAFKEKASIPHRWYQTSPPAGAFVAAPCWCQTRRCPLVPHTTATRDCRWHHTALLVPHTALLVPDTPLLVPTYPTRPRCQTHRTRPAKNGVCAVLKPYSQPPDKPLTELSRVMPAPAVRLRFLPEET